ncbi:MAG: hypothetical protein EXR78_09395 [Deltaproteobacteria bacterium]|nr:hypothetical protein [Deltaproteobacteria bacterium]
MRCPHCNTPMREITKTGLLLDVCPDCKGTWLDRGELDKLLTRARKIERAWEDTSRPLERQRRDYDDDDDDRRYASAGRDCKKRRWTEIFDIFD